MKAENKRKSAAKERDKKQNRATRRGVILISVLAVVILIVNIVTASFSWFAPNSVNGAGMEYKKTTYNRSESIRKPPITVPSSVLFTLPPVKNRRNMMKQMAFMRILSNMLK